MVGERLALLARKYAYGEDILADAPRMESVARKKNIVTITWNNAGDGIVVKGDRWKDFMYLQERKKKLIHLP